MRGSPKQDRSGCSGPDSSGAEDADPGVVVGVVGSGSDGSFGVSLHASPAPRDAEPEPCEGATADLRSKPPRDRGPNDRLRELLGAAGVSNAGLARRVNDLGARRGLALRYDKTSVARWVGKGMTPQGPVPHLIAAVLAERLGRPVPLEEIGLDDSRPVDPDLGLAFPRDVGEAVRTATDLWRHDHVNRRELLAGTFAVSAYGTPMARWLITPADARAEHRGAGPHVGHSDVSKLRDAAAEARRWDSRFGGGDWRASMVPECLRSDATPLLRGSYHDDVGRRLFGATAELSRLAGWMAFDMGRHEIAQRYYIQALRLARAGADVPLGGYVLATMSLQATYRGNPDMATDLAQAAIERNKGIATARVTGFLHLVEARAHARAGDAVACGRALNAAEAHLERARPGDPDPEWIDFFTWDRLCADGAECYRDLGVPDRTRYFTAQALAGMRGEAFQRSHGLRLAVGAQAELRAGEVEAACASGRQALEIADRVHSSRNAAYLNDLIQDLRPYRDVRAVREFTERARLVDGLAV